MSVAYAVFPLNLSFLVTANGFGDAASVSVGMTTITVVSALVGLVLPQLIRMSKLFLCTLGSAFGLAAALVVMFAQNMGMVYVGTVLAGIFFGINMASPGYYVSRICTPAQYGPTYSLATSVNYLGIILSPVILSFITGAWGGDPEVALNAFVTGAGMFALVLVLNIVWNAYLTKKLPAEEPTGAPADAPQEWEEEEAVAQH